MGAPAGARNASKYKPWEDALRRAITQDDGKRLRKAAEMLVDAAAEGDLQAIKELGDRLDGKAKQSIDVEARLQLSEAQIEARLKSLQERARRT